VDFLTYSELLKRGKIYPTFFTSGDYFKASGWSIIKNKRCDIVEEVFEVRDEDGLLIFPVLTRGGELVKSVKEDIEIDYEGFYSPYLNKEEFDLEYFYSPSNFLDLSGGSFKVFRKNCRKASNYGFEYKDVTDIDRILGCLEKWAGERLLYGNEIMIKYLMECNNVKGLFFGKELMGFNAWDDNFKYTNFRYCMDNRKVPFLNEYLRLLFYREMSDKNKIINDGGVLGDEGLKRFKNKLNPIMIRTRCSWIKTKKEN